MNAHKDKAKDLFASGAQCAQATIGPLQDVISMEKAADVTAFLNEIN